MRELFSLDPPEEKEARWPMCDCCDRPIRSDYLFDIDGTLYCEDCIESEFKRETEDYIEG